jgi:hypothetical protein
MNFDENLSILDAVNEVHMLSPIDTRCTDLEDDAAPGSVLVRELESAVGSALATPVDIVESLGRQSPRAAQPLEAACSVAKVDLPTVTCGQSPSKAPAQEPTGSSHSAAHIAATFSPAKTSGINVVCDAEIFSSPAVVTRHFSGIGAPLVGVEIASKSARAAPGQPGNGTDGAMPIKIPTLEEVVAFGGIPNPLMSEVRSSERIRAQPNADATQLQRAMQSAQRRHAYGTPGTNISNHSFFIFV